ncbi:CDP-glucose 4,6-dehydratase [Rhodospirillales bacterium]|nr:CDP-glucose 4,6-dehydratase [Rhodospirillales bacterium]
MKRDFWRGKKVLVTGHTGFTGAWMARWLVREGAEVCGLALPPETAPDLYSQLRLDAQLRSEIFDIRDNDKVNALVNDFRPEFICHLAAQSLVRKSYKQPQMTWATNVMGTLNILEAIRNAEISATTCIVTSDKVYKNNETGDYFDEQAPLGGDDPYSSSKAAVEILTAAWRKSYFGEKSYLVTARAGNIVGGGDWSEDRLVPDIVRAIAQETPLVLRNPDATRPWQHVLDAVAGYLLYLEKASVGGVSNSLNFGPSDTTSVTVQEVCHMMIDHFDAPIKVAVERDDSMKEKRSLGLNVSRVEDELGWKTQLGMSETIKWTCDWYAQYQAGEPALDLVDSQLDRYWGLS